MLKILMMVMRIMNRMLMMMRTSFVWSRQSFLGDGVPVQPRGEEGGEGAKGLWMMMTTIVVMMIITMTIVIIMLLLTILIMGMKTICC